MVIGFTWKQVELLDEKEEEFGFSEGEEDGVYIPKIMRRIAQRRKLRGQ